MHFIMVNEIWKGIQVDTLLPKLWVMHAEYNIDFDDFSTSQCTCCVLEWKRHSSHKLPPVFYRRKGPQNDAWKGFVATSRTNQKELNRVQIGWCMAMTFSAKEHEKPGTTNLQSKHYIALARLSLVHLWST